MGQNTTNVPIPPIQRSNKKQIPLKMDWVLIIHKSQRMTLTRATIDIGKTECQVLIFTTMSHTTTLEGIQIALLFSFECYEKIKDTTYVSLRKKEDTHLHALSLS